ncbi:MAG: tetratricopeptide repeat protein [Deltaproteobacteria bacterium]|nr:tetratricopeptide repeat protein [Deltaproteobacteria bacterium]
MPRRTNFPGLAACLAALVLSAAPRAVADDAEIALALYQEAVDLAKEGKYEAAIVLFEKAHGLGAPPVVLYNIGKCYQDLDDLDEAVEFYEQYIEAPDIEDAADVEAIIEELEATPSPVNLETIPTGAVVHELLTDSTRQELGSTPLEITADAGSHSYIIEKEGFKPKKIKLKAGMGKPFELEIKLTKKAESKSKKPKGPGLGLFFEAGGGASLHVFKGVEFAAGGEASLGIGWRFARGMDTGFSIALRSSFRPYRLTAVGEDRTYGSLLTAILAVPAFQLRLHERLALEASVPIGVAVLTPLDPLSSTTEIELVGGTIQDGGVPLFDVGAGVALRIGIVSGLYAVIQPIHLHILVPTTTWQNDTKALIDIDMGVRLGFEL